MKTGLFILALTFALNLVTGDVWSAPFVKDGISAKDQSLSMGDDTRLNNEDKPIVIKVASGQKFDIYLPGYYWNYVEYYGLDCYTWWYQNNGTIYRFRVLSWYMGDELPLTFKRNDGKVIRYLIVKA